MKIKVADLEPNPFRQMDRYSIDRAKVEMLKAKIDKTMFWDNILARPNKKGKYQIAYGHHRLIALQELGIKQVDIPIKDISDSDMVLIMADENHRMMPNPAIMNETILAIKQYLDNEFSKYDRISDLPSHLSNLTDGMRQEDFKRLGDNGVGRDTILKFLGAEWKPSIIRIALNIIKTSPEILDRKAVEKMPSIRKAERFTQAVKNYQVPIKQQNKLADEIIEKDTSAESIAAFVRSKAPKEQIEQKDPVMDGLKRMITDIDQSANALFHKIMILRSRMKELDITELKGIKVWLAASSLKQLFKELERLKGKDSL